MRPGTFDGIKTKNPATYRELEIFQSETNIGTSKGFIRFGIILFFIHSILFLLSILGYGLFFWPIHLIILSVISIISLLLGTISSLLFRISIKNKNTRNITIMPAMYLILGYCVIIANVIISILVIIRVMFTRIE